MKEHTFKWKGITLGTCYYFEQWGKKYWRRDLKRMKQFGISVVRIGEFCWSMIEPEEGRFHFEILDDFLGIAQEEGMKVILAVPTPAPPVWLSEKYPEILSRGRMNEPKLPGMRRYCSYNSPAYRKFSSRLVKKMASHLGQNSAIIGWQIEDVPDCRTELFRSKADDDAFRDYARKKYKSIDVLNEVWGTDIWNRKYSDWSEVHVPGYSIHDQTNPHREIDFRRFISESVISFCVMIREIIDKYKKADDFITAKSLRGNINNRKLMTECLDVYTTGSYPGICDAIDVAPNPEEFGGGRQAGFYLSDARAVCKNFGVMEQQTGASGRISGKISPAPRPGQMSLWATQSIAHGADFISFLRWRTQAHGAEIYSHGLLERDNGDNRFTAELAGIAERAEKLSGLCGSRYAAKVAMMRDYENERDCGADVLHHLITYASEKAIFKVSQTKHTPVDIMYLSDRTEESDLADYDVIIYPHPTLISRKRAKILREYVRGGGKLVLGARSGEKDMNGRGITEDLPASFSTGTDIIVKEYSVTPRGVTNYVEWNGKRLDTGHISDVLNPPEDEVDILARYATDYFAGEPALTKRTAGNGELYRFGGSFTPDFTEELFSYLGVLEPYSETADIPQECELAVRASDAGEFMFILNYSPDRQTVNLKRAATDTDSGADVSGEIVIEPYGTKIFKL